MRLPPGSFRFLAVLLPRFTPVLVILHTVVFPAGLRSGIVAGLVARHVVRCRWFPARLLRSARGGPLRKADSVLRPAIGQVRVPD